MASFLIKGDRPLQGKIVPAGNKNAILPIMAATLLTPEECVIENVPPITDVEVMAAILTDLGGQVDGLGTRTLRICCRQVAAFEVNPALASRLRASILLIGPLLARFGQVKIPFPGGDIIGQRAIDTHLEAFQQMGVKITTDGDIYELLVPRRLRGDVFPDEVSVTATENLIMFAAGKKLKTTLNRAASEPHVENLATFLTAMGAVIAGAGTNRVIIEGSTNLQGAKGEIDPDYIEIGTFMIAAAVTGGQVRIVNGQLARLGIIPTYFKRMGMNFAVDNQDIVVSPGKLQAPRLGKIQTQVWPGFPSDLMSPMIVLATQAEGTTLCHDWMYDWRMFFVDKLVRMGGKIIICDPHRILVDGPTRLRGREMSSPDIRAGIALVLAALCARGDSRIHRIEHIDRGYAQLESRLRALGAQIERVADD